MRILAIDTAQRRRVVCAVVDDDGHRGRVVDDASIDDALPQLLADAVAEPLDAVVVVVGPGSFTGVRAGMAAAAGLAQAQALPLHGAGALDVVAAAAPESAQRVHALSDAGRDGLYVADYWRTSDGLRVDGGVRRVAAAGHRPPAGAVVVALERLGMDGDVVVGDPVIALAAAARAAVRGAPLDLRRLRAVEPGRVPGARV